MCRGWYQIIYLCQQADNVGTKDHNDTVITANTCKHIVIEPEERCPTGRNTRRGFCTPPANATDQYKSKTCYDSPGCCERFLDIVVKKWTWHRKNRLRGGFDEVSKRLGADLVKVYNQHIECVEKVNDLEECLMKLIDEALTDDRLPLVASTGVSGYKW